MTTSTKNTAETLVPESVNVAPLLADTLPPPTRGQVERLLRLGAGRFEGIDPELDPDAVVKTCAQLCRWIERARDRDPTPLLQLMPDPVTGEPSDVLWLEVFAALIEHAKRTMTHGIVWVARSEDVMLLSQAIQEALELVERVKTAIHGNGVLPEQSAALASKIIANRNPSRTRTGMKLELGYLRVGIEESPEATPALRLLVPQILAGKRHLSLAVEGKRLPMKVKQYGPEVHVAVLALLLGMNEFLAWASATATMARLRTFRRIVAPRHRADGSPILRLDPAAPVEEGEELDPLPADDEEDGPAAPSDGLLPHPVIDPIVGPAVTEEGAGAAKEV